MSIDYKISYIRAIATLLVVIIHITQHLSYTYPAVSVISDWGNLGLVMFFVMSAFLYSQRTITSPVKWLVKRYIEISIPSLLTVVLFLVGYQLFIGGLYPSRIVSSILCGLGFEEFVPDPWMFVQLWYLTYILICYLSIPLIQKINFKKSNESMFWGGIVVVTIVLQILSSIPEILFNAQFPLSWAQFVRFFLPYAIFKRYSIVSQKLKRIMYILTGVSIIAIVLTCYLRYFCKFDGLLLSVSELLFIYTQSLSGLVLFYWLYILFKKIKYYEKLCYFTNKYSYTVYLTHCLFIGYSTSMIDKFDSIAIGIAVALLCTALSSIVIEFLSLRVKKGLFNIPLIN